MSKVEEKIMVTTGEVNEKKSFDKDYLGVTLVAVPLVLLWLMVILLPVMIPDFSLGSVLSSLWQSDSFDNSIAWMLDHEGLVLGFSGVLLIVGMVLIFMGEKDRSKGIH